MPLYDRLIKIEGLSRLPAGEREALRLDVERLEKSAARVAAQDNGGGSRSANLRRLVVDGDLYVPAGVVKIGPDTTGNVVINTNGIKLNYGTVNKIWLQTDGDVLIGDDTSAPGSTYIAIFSTAQSYGTVAESMGAGDMLIGDNSASKANILWDKSAGQLLFRGGTTTTIFVDTTGKLTFLNNIDALQFRNTSGSIGGRINYANNNDFYILNDNVGEAIILQIQVTSSSPNLTWAEDAGQANRTHLVLGAGVQGGKITLSDGSSLADTVIQTAGGSGGSTYANFPGALNVGDVVNTTAGGISYTGNLISRKGSSDFTGYIFVPLTAPLTSTSWDGDAFSTTGKTIIDLSAVFGAPAEIVAALVRVAIRDSASSTNDCVLFLSPTNVDVNGPAVNCTAIDDRFNRAELVVPCVGGDFYYQIAASGASTFDVSLQIWGYWI